LAIEGAWRGPLVELSVCVLVVDHHLVELHIKAAGTVAGFGKLSGLREWLARLWRARAISRCARSML
jgi:hypothetical protein